MCLTSEGKLLLNKALQRAATLHFFGLKVSMSPVNDITICAEWRDPAVAAVL